MVIKKITKFTFSNLQICLIYYFSKNFLRALLTFSMLLTIDGYKVLFLGPFNGKSHFLYMQSFVLALLDRGHEVTFLTSQSLNHLKLENYTEVLIDPPFDLYSLCKFQNSI